MASFYFHSNNSFSISCKVGLAVDFSLYKHLFVWQSLYLAVLKESCAEFARIIGCALLSNILNISSHFLLTLKLFLLTHIPWIAVWCIQPHDGAGSPVSESLLLGHGVWLERWLPPCLTLHILGEPGAKTFVDNLLLGGGFIPSKSSSLTVV